MSASGPKNVAAYREATRAALLGLVINLALGITKLIAGLVAHSFALLADAVNSLGDVLVHLEPASGHIAENPPA